MILLIYSLTVLALEMVCVDIFFNAFCAKRRNNKWFNIAMYVLMWGTSFVICNLNYLRNRLALKIVMVILIITLFMYVVYRINIIQSIVLASLFETIDLLFDFLISVIVVQVIGNLLSIQGDFDAAGNVIVVVGKSLLFISVLIIRNIFGKENAEALNFKEWIKFLVCPFVTICILCAVCYESGGFRSFQSDISNLMIVIGLVVINIAQYYMLNDTLKSQARLRENDRMVMEMESQRKLYESISDNYEKQRNMAHEYKNHLLCVEALASKKDYDNLKKYVSRLCGKFDGVFYAIDTNNPIINAVVNTKYQEAIDNETLLSFLVDDLYGIRVDDEDMVVILSNLLNNALEACKKCDERIIRFKALREKGKIIISVENSCNEKATYKDGQIVTTKTDNPEQHGIGIKNVINIVNKYNGEYVIKSDDNKFLFSIVIPEKG
ncbi:MAG: sensor histidine kinase [Lachnospira sp.]